MWSLANLQGKALALSALGHFIPKLPTILLFAMELLFGSGNRRFQEDYMLGGHCSPNCLLLARGICVLWVDFHHYAVARNTEGSIALWQVHIFRGPVSFHATEVLFFS